MPVTGATSTVKRSVTLHIFTRTTTKLTPPACDAIAVCAAQVLILKGPDKGRTGKIVGIIKSRSEAIVRVDGTTREMRILELSDVARQLPDDPKMTASTPNGKKEK